MLLKKGLGVVGELVGEQGDAFEVFFTRKFDDRFEEKSAVALTAMVGVDDDVFHNQNKAAHSRRNRKEEVGHSHDAILGPCDEDATACGFFQDVADAFFLKSGVGGEVFLQVEEVDDEVGQRREVFNGGRLNVDFRRHGRFWSGSGKMDNELFSKRVTVLSQKRF